MLRTSLPAFAVALAFGLSKVAIAQAQSAEPSQPTAANASSADDENSLQTVTVTATRDSVVNLQTPSTAGSRLPETSLQTPASVTVISGDLVRDFGYTSLVSAETLAPGITSVPFSGNGNNSLSARGFYGPNAIAQLYDGMQLFNGGGVVTFPFDPWNVERIDVLTGPASVLYGTGFVGGAVNVISKEPDPEQRSNTAQLGYGSFETAHAAADSTGPVTPWLSYRANVSAYNSNGWVQRGQSDSLASSGALRFQPLSNLVVSLNDDFGNIEPTTYEGTPVYDNHVLEALRYINYNIADAGIDFRENRLRLREDWDASPDVSVTNDSYLITQYRYYHETYNFVYTPATDTVLRNDYRDINAEQRQWGDHGFSTFKYDVLGLKNAAVVGFDLNRSVYDRNDNSTASGGYPGSSTVNAASFDPGVFPTGVSDAYPQYDLTLQQAGAFAEDHLTLTKSVSLSAGIRDDHYSTDRVQFFPTAGVSSGTYDGAGWNAGVVYAPITNLSFYAQYAKATNPVTSLASISTSQEVFALSPAKQVEIGAKQLFWNDRLQWTVALYHIVEDNLLSPSAANPNVSEEVGSQSSHGVEVSFSARLTDTLVLSANGTTLSSRYDIYYAEVNGVLTSYAGHRPEFVPDQTANVLASWQFVPRWQARAALQYVGDRFADTPNHDNLPAYAVLNVGMRWLVSPKWNVDVALDNATNKLYAAATYAGVGNQWILGEPRSVMVTLNAAF